MDTHRTKTAHPGLSLNEIHGSVDTTVNGSRWKRVLAFIGPAYLVSVGYMDPGNWATDLAGGSRYGYTLLWVLLMSNLMALLLQSLSARLGLVRGRDLAQANRETYPPVTNFILYLLAEVAIAACDLAEVLGMAIGLNLLFGLPLIWGVLITFLDTLLLLYLQKLGMRKMELFIISLIAVIGCCFLVELFLARPRPGEVISGLLPSIPDAEALYIAIGIIGATVMPHNLYLHSALVQTRKIKKDEASLRRAIRLNVADSAIALNLAFFVNAAILVLAAAVFYKSGHTGIAELGDAHQLLEPLLGSAWAPRLFAVALIVAGQSSTVTGTLAGQIVMEGYLRLRINPALRRMITRLLAIIPAVLTILIAGEQQVGSLLIFSQVLLSLQLGFAIIPLIHFVSDKPTMGKFAIRPLTRILAWLITAILVYLNLRMVYGTVAGQLFAAGHWGSKLLIAGAAILFLVLLLVTFWYPLLSKRKTGGDTRIHPEHLQLGDFVQPVYDRIAIALDFSRNDEKTISAAVAQGHAGTHYLLIHVVESASARMMEQESADYESQHDRQQLDTYVRLLAERGQRATGFLAHHGRSRSIVRIVREQHADLLVMGGHGHRGFKDWLYGETASQVAHAVKVPVLIVK
ncbi:Nramp family divalent metal transporter [Compostibacter hankyongensis]|uniref:Divalent metal cation transporter MntH n=1 Tax=Compostibacter hankyongensis TaxID=1007089 RepID=A0ABP8G922_9BACT